MDWRTAIYPLGFIASLAFAIRFIIQWIESEVKGKSIVSPSFWTISFAGNLALALHTFIQVQYPFCLIQGINAAMAWRNINMMEKNPCRFRTMIFLLIAVAAFITLAFIIQGLLSFGYIDWIRTPSNPWQKESGQPAPLFWHILGFIGAAIFAFRFWLQWWNAERSGKSEIRKSFWQLSLIGASIALVYFIHIGDLVNIAGYSLGIIPYARNLVLLKRQS